MRLSLSIIKMSKRILLGFLKPIIQHITLITWIKYFNVSSICFLYSSSIPCTLSSCYSNFGSFFFFSLLLGRLKQWQQGWRRWGAELFVTRMLLCFCFHWETWWFISTPSLILSDLQWWSWLLCLVVVSKHRVVSYNEWSSFNNIRKF